MEHQSGWTRVILMVWPPDWGLGLSMVHQSGSKMAMATEWFPD
jgi:hypothetical protein